MFRPLLTCLIALGSPAFSHEFWLSPLDYTIDAGQDVSAHIRVGQSFKGGAFSYIDRNTTRFDIVMSDTVTPTTSIVGDRPAMTQVAPATGLAIVVHETTDSSLTYKEWQKFVNFAKHKAFKGTLEDHVARGLPDKDFKESYRRFAKSLIAVGDGAGSDQQVGLRTEIVALKNPYTDDLSDGLPVQVFFEGTPRVNAQVELFAKVDDGEATISLYQTDENGIAILPMAPGTEYMADAVVMLPLTAKTPNDAIWQSLWANLTFHTP